MPPFYPYGAPPERPPAHPPAPPRYPPYPPQAMGPRSDNRALAALGLGLLSVTCLGFFAGIPAIVLGAMSRKEIDRSRGALTGARIAAGGIVTGLFGTGLSLVILVALLGGALDTTKEARGTEQRAEAPLRVPVAAGTRSYGNLDVVDLDGAAALQAQLADITRTAGGKGRTIILQTYVRQSRECAEVAAALPDARMQRALANVTLVRVDIDAFEGELKTMRVDTESVPWFYKLDTSSRPTDAISADEWDANIPENMAPVLGDFARGALGSRRSPSAPPPARPSFPASPFPASPAPTGTAL